MSSLLDYYLYYDEDQDLDESQMSEFSPVEAAHVRELVERGLLASGEILSHKGWHHRLYRKDGVWWGCMWDGPTGEERWYLDLINEWEQ